GEGGGAQGDAVGGAPQPAGGRPLPAGPHHPRRDRRAPLLRREAEAAVRRRALGADGEVHVGVRNARMSFSFAPLLTRMQELRDLGGAIGLLTWDQETYLPARADEAR